MRFSLNKNRNDKEFVIKIMFHNSETAYVYASFRVHISYVSIYIHPEDNRPCVRVVCHAYAYRCSHPYIQYAFACLRYAYIRARHVVIEGSDYVGRRIRIFGHTHIYTHTRARVSPCVYMCVFEIHGAPGYTIV